ncbi:MAG: peptidase, partial [Candidatus Marinimicrobia bacterium]|nr:peptidase [Candidatus Neomarinimicrobiota bacterium]
MQTKLILLLSITTLILAFSCQNQPDSQVQNGERIQMIEETLNQFAETQITYDHSLLNENQMKVVEHLYNAAVITDSLFLRQVYKHNREIRDELRQRSDREGRLTLDLFNIMFGPFNRLEEDEPFYGDHEKPEGANYYPMDMTREEFNQWIEEHPDQTESFTSEYTIIRRENGQLVAIPYSEYYSDALTAAANELRQAAEFAENPTLKKYLTTRADAFLSNDYYESDMAWMDLEDHTIE